MSSALPGKTPVRPLCSIKRGEVQNQKNSDCFAQCRSEVLPREPYYWKAGSGSSRTLKERIARRDWYYNATQLQPVLNKYQVELIRKVLPPGSVRLGYGNLSVHRRQEREVLRLHETSWPSYHDGPAWPTTPTFNEWLEMIRYGNFPLDRVYDNCTLQVSLRQFNSDIGLAKRIIRRQIIGIRSDIAVPAKYWGYFRYRWNFLILTSPTCLPSGLTRFLASIWCTDPHSLWLERKVTLKQYLRSVPKSVFNRSTYAVSDCSGTTSSVELIPRIDSSPERLLTSVGPPLDDPWSWEMESSSSDDS